ncbi:hypothetical protein C1J00_44340, partial [Streptomyces cahuitamycinicus]
SGAGAVRPGDDAGGGQRPARYDESAAPAWPGNGTRRSGDDDADAGQAETWAGPGQTDAGSDPARHGNSTGQAWPGSGAGRPGDDAGGGQPGVRGGERCEEAGPYAPGTPYRPPNPGTNPYLRVPDELL